MRNVLRTALAAAVTVTALAAAPSALAAPAQGHAQGQQHNSTCLVRSNPNPLTIRASDYNRARDVLAQAGSMSARKSHILHGVGTVPSYYGTSLLECARDEFRSSDWRIPGTRSGMTLAHYNAIHRAAQTMGLSRW